MNGPRIALVIGSLVTFVACSDDGNGGADPSGAGGTGGSSSGKGGKAGSGSSQTGGSGSSQTGGSGAPSLGGSGGNGGSMLPSSCGMTSTDNAFCTAQQYVGQNVPLDIYVMFDVSGSMLQMDSGSTTTRMDAVRSAVEQFLNAPGSGGINIGLGYFGHQPIGMTTCNPADYTRPAVPMGVLPGNVQSLVASLRAAQPTGETPTGAAIRGACSYAKGWKQMQAGHQVAILLVTDGEPQAPRTVEGGGSCNPTLQDATAAAAECLAQAPGLKTYVLGVGPSLNNLKSIAQAGGTADAYLVANGGTADILKALHAIRGDATIPCALQVPRPSSGDVDFTKVNVVYRDAACMPTTLVNVTNASGCTANGGWYYDNAAKPESIQLCPASCETVKKPGSQLNVTVGCATRIIE